MPLLKVVHLLQKMNKKVICTLIKIIYDVKKITSKSQISSILSTWPWQPGAMSIQKFP